MIPSSAAAHVFVDDLSAPVLAEDDHWHLRRSLRLGAGAEVTASDGTGWWRPCRLDARGELEPVGDAVAEPSSQPEIVVAFALVKGQRPDLVVQKLTELGVDRIVPFVAERSVVRWDPAKAARHVDRFSRIVRHAGMQSRRCRLPVIGMPNDASLSTGHLPAFSEVAMLPGAFMADVSGGPPSQTTSTILIGPEGGWTDTERALGVPRVRLGTHVLRAETAAITAGAFLAALRSDIISTSLPAQVVAPSRDVIV